MLSPLTDFNIFQLTQQDVVKRLLSMHLMATCIILCYMTEVKAACARQSESSPDDDPCRRHENKKTKKTNSILFVSQYTAR